MKRTVTIATLALVLAACGDSDPTAFWDEIPNGDNWQAFIAEDAEAGDCAALQDTFNALDNANIDYGPKGKALAFVDDVMDEVGCY